MTFLSSAHALLRFMGTRVYASFPSISQEAAFLGIDDYDAVERRLEVFERQLKTSFRNADDQGMSVWEAMQEDNEVAALSDFRLYGFGRADGLAIPEDQDPCCGGVSVDSDDAPWLIGTAGGCSTFEEYGTTPQQVLQRLKACGCTEIYWC